MKVRLDIPSYSLINAFQSPIFWYWLFAVYCISIAVYVPVSKYRYQKIHLRVNMHIYPYSKSERMHF